MSVPVVSFYNEEDRDALACLSFHGIVSNRREGPYYVDGGRENEAEGEIRLSGIVNKLR